jgi:hypothetical protein
MVQHGHGERQGRPQASTSEPCERKSGVSSRTCDKRRPAQPLCWCGSLQRPQMCSNDSTRQEQQQQERSSSTMDEEDPSDRGVTTARMTLQVSLLASARLAALEPPLRVVVAYMKHG